MHGNGTVYKRCGCRDPRSKRQLGTKCPKFAQRGHGAWYVSLPVWATADDPRSRLRQGGYPSKAEAIAALQRLVDPTLPRRGSRLTTAKWLGRWLEDAEERLRPTTVRGYRKHIEQYLAPLLGKVCLRELTYDHIQQAFSRIIQKRRAAGDAISAATLRRIQATLRAALAAAVNARLIDHNPARDLDLPKERRPHAQVWSDALVAQWKRTGERPPVAVWTPIQTAEFLHIIRDHRLYALYHLYALRGLRRGEALGLLWSDIDFDHAVVTIQRQLQKRAGGIIEACPPKTRAGQRQVALDRGTLRVLRATTSARKPNASPPASAGRRPATCSPTPLANLLPQTWSGTPSKSSCGPVSCRRSGFMTCVMARPASRSVPGST
ncbi:site-specific integrase [Kitasatospora acidiphila]|uniref:site-specific integrase n=1 Tax=Kitasatospora acidiphila TaxID=2567942 RepID=UPI001C67C269|nr:tyrosine-type recombinase/integrase [Kitasatospora acidiphila]